MIATCSPSLSSDREQLDSQLFELKMLFRWTLDQTLGEILNKLSSILHYFETLQAYAQKENKNIGLVFQELCHNAGIQIGCTISRTPPAGKKVLETKQHLVTRQLINMIRLKIEDATDLKVAEEQFIQAQHFITLVLHRSDVHEQFSLRKLQSVIEHM